MSLFGKIIKAVRKLFSKDSIQKYFCAEAAISSNMADEADKWYRMYTGHAPWISEDMISLRLEQGIVREFANITLNEMSVQVSNEKLDKIFRRAIADLNRNFQEGLASGSMIIKPLGIDCSEVQYVPQTSFIPLQYNASGRLTDVIFPEIKKIGDRDYRIRMERHTLDENGLTITNRAFRSDSPNVLGNEIPLSSVPEWADLSEKEQYPKMTRPSFGYYVNPISNIIDGSPAGVSVYATAERLIKRADIQFGRLDWEYDSAERALHVDIQALKLSENGSYNLPKKRLYRGLDLQRQGEELFHEFSPALRDDGYINGLEEYKRAIEFTVGRSYGDLSNPSTVDKTATEVRAAKQRKYNTVTAIQNNLRDCLDDLAYALAFYNSMTADCRLSCSFEDSILSTDEERRKLDREEVAMGAMSLVEYRMKWYGEDEETAKSKLPQSAEVID